MDLGGNAGPRLPDVAEMGWKRKRRLTEDGRRRGCTGPFGGPPARGISRRFAEPCGGPPATEVHLGCAEPSGGSPTAAELG